MPTNEMDATTLYEHPVNQRMRMYLRLEQLFIQTSRYLASQNPWSHRAAIITVIELLDFLDRNDIKADTIKELDRHIQVLTKLKSSAQVDLTKLQQLLTQLDHINRSIYHHNGKFGQKLRESEFFNVLRQRLIIPGGNCSFDLPALHYFLHLPHEQRRQCLESWLGEFSLVQEAATLLLTLSRESASFASLQALQGFYQQESYQNCQLLRVRISNTLTVYPEISAGRHRFTLRFLGFSSDKRPLQTPDDISFELACCF